MIEAAPLATGDANTKKRQYEYDALGELISVCELTSGTGSGSCAQNTTPQTGYWTKYSYDALGDLVGVTQNAQPNGTAQTRGFTYDALRRMTSEINPETGTVNYTYDSDATCGTSNGDKLKRVDQAGNVTCYAYDILHRVTKITYPSGPYATNTPGKYFFYDTNSTWGQNEKGRLDEAYTCTALCDSPFPTIPTNEYFSYSPRGEVIEVHQYTPHGGTSFTQTYWEHGAPKQLSGLPGLAAITYGGTIGTTVGLDGEGRITQVTAGSGQNPVTGVTYTTSGTTQPIGALTQVNFGSSDSDQFGYDPNTGRPTQYTFSVNSQTDSGTLTWNANGSLKQLLIVDNLPGTSDGQTCNYTHDDLSRLGSVTCTIQITIPVWVQNFSYDAFGNINKSGNASFLPGTYVAASNRVPTSFGFSYDNNGNVTSDTLHSYTWDAEGHAVTIDNKQLTYDALGRMVEQVPSTDTNCTTPSNCTQIIYGPDGGKLALMHGQTLSKAFVPLPGGAAAVYNSSGLVYYRHSDHLGSSRLASTPARTLYYSGAYAPFGESYAETGTTDRSFTGQNEDTVPGMADFMYREYSSAQQGRWISPDPSGLAAVDPTDPQSWNRYAYVRNRPLTSVDPDGLDARSGGCWFPAQLGEDQLGNDNASSVSFGDCLNAGGFWLGGTIDLERDYGFGSSDFGLAPSFYELGRREYQKQVDCGFNPGSCGDSAPTKYDLIVNCSLSNSVDYTCLFPDSAITRGGYYYHGWDQVAATLGEAGHLAAPGVKTATYGTLAFIAVATPYLLIETTPASLSITRLAIPEIPDGMTVAEFRQNVGWSNGSFNASSGITSNMILSWARFYAQEALVRPENLVAVARAAYLYKLYASLGR